MADTKISQLTDGVTVLATDRIPVARSPFAAGDNKYVTGTELAAFIEANLTAAEVQALISPLPIANGGTGQTTEAEALGEMIQALSTDGSPDVLADYIVTYDASADTGKKVLLSDISSGGRAKLTANTTLYVRTAPTTVTVSIASPAVVSWPSHGLSINDPVVFSAPVNFGSCTMTQANPGVVSRTGHGFVAGDAVQFHTEGILPTNIVASDTYYVHATGLTADAFSVAATPGGTRIDTSAGAMSGNHFVQYTQLPLVGTCTISLANPAVVTCVGHGLVAGTVVMFGTTGALPDAIQNGGTFNYHAYVSATDLATDTFKIVGTLGGIDFFNTSGDSQSGTHRLYRVSSFPTGMFDGEICYVISAGFGANSFQFARTVGGAAINTTGTTLNYIRAQTGNDANNGSAATRTGAFLSINAAVSHAIDNYDFNNFGVTIQLAKGLHGEKTWTNGVGASDALDLTLASVGSGAITLAGDTANVEETVLSAAPDIGDIARFGGSASGPALSCYGLHWHTPSYAAINWQPTYKTGAMSNCSFSGGWSEEGVILNTNRSRLQCTGTFRIFGWPFGPHQHNWIQSSGTDSFASMANCAVRLMNNPIFDEGIYTCSDNAITTSLVFYEGTVGSGSLKFTLSDGGSMLEQYGLGRDQIPGTDYTIGSGLCSYTLDDVAGGQVDYDQLRVSDDSGISSTESGNPELLKFTSNASAINEITIANAAIGSGPTISCTGDDSNIPLNFTAKGSPGPAYKFNYAGTNVLMELNSTTGGGSGPTLRLFHDTASPANNDYPVNIHAHGRDSANNSQLYGEWDFRIVDTTSGSEDGAWEAWVVVAGSSNLRASIGEGMIIGTGQTFPGVGNLVLSTAGSFVRTTATIVGSLPAAATAGAGARAFVTDATVTTFASVVAGTGGNGVPVYSDGTNWRIG